MAVDLTKVTNPNNSAIEVYRANMATPQGLEEMRFWVQNELGRIQDGFFSTDEIIKLVASAVVDGGGDGQDGADGAEGQQGAAGDGISVFQQQSEPTGAIAGDVWFVMGYV